MTPRALIDRYLPAFVSVGIEDAKNDCAVLLASVLNRPWLELLFDRDTELSQAQEEAFQLLCTQRIQR